MCILHNFLNSERGQMLYGHFSLKFHGGVFSTVSFHDIKRKENSYACYNLFLWVLVLCVSVCLHACAPHAWYPRRHWIPLELELQTVASCHEGQIQTLYKCTQPSGHFSSPIFMCFKVILSTHYMNV